MRLRFGTAIAILFVAAPLMLARTPTGATAQAPQPNPGIARVFVHTDDNGEPSELAARQQSVKDLVSSLATKKKTITVVGRKDSADVVLEVLDRGLTVPKVVIGIGARPGQPSTQGAGVRVVVLRTRLTFGTESFDLTNKNKPAETLGGWRSAAENIGDQVEKWIANRMSPRQAFDATIPLVEGLSAA